MRPRRFYSLIRCARRTKTGVSEHRVQDPQTWKNCDHIRDVYGVEVVGSSETAGSTMSLDGCFLYC